MRLCAHRLAALVCMLAAVNAWAGDLPPPPTLDDMIEPETVVAMTISPDGKHVAGIGYTGHSTSLFVIDTATRKPSYLDIPSSPQSRFDWRTLVRVNWISDDLLALDFNSEQAESVDLKGNRVAKLGERFVQRMPGKDGSPDTVLAFSDLAGGDLQLVDGRTGRRRNYPVDLAGRIVQGAFDAAGELRAVTIRDTVSWAEKTKISNWYRSDEKSAWRLLEEFPVTADYWWPVRVLPEPDSLAVLSRHDRDTYALFRYDTVGHRHGGLMAGDPDADIGSVRGLDTVGLAGITTFGMKPEHFWFDAGWAGVQASVDAELPGRINTLSGDPQGSVLIASYSDVDPGRWLLLDVPTMTMSLLGRARPKVDPKRMRPMETLQYTARDQLKVNAYLTRPAAPIDRPAPTVVLIHGGPNVRDGWGWNEEVQILASRGYVVFQPQFRGSAGFGRRFEEAGYLQWGRAMQDDITDGVTELIARQIADPDRICIVGASYGGYAALWGVISTPTLYRCGVSFAGVSDLEEMMAHSLRDDSDALSREIRRSRVGDPQRMREQFDAVSPVKNAARVQVPLLIMHGELDTRVLPSHSADMVAALRKNGKTVDWLRFSNEAHGLRWIGNRRAYYTAELAFLERCLALPAAAERPIPAGPAPSGAAP